MQLCKPWYKAGQWLNSSKVPRGLQFIGYVPSTSCTQDCIHYKVQHWWWLSFRNIWMIAPCNLHTTCVIAKVLTQDVWHLGLSPPQPEEILNWQLLPFQKSALSIRSNGMRALSPGEAVPLCREKCKICWVKLDGKQANKQAGGVWPCSTMMQAFPVITTCRNLQIVTGICKLEHQGSGIPRFYSPSQDYFYFLVNKMHENKLENRDWIPRLLSQCFQRLLL